MNYHRKYDTRIPHFTARIHEFLQTKHLSGRVEYEFQPTNVNEPTGWAILAVDTCDPKIRNELDSFISNLERIAMLESKLEAAG
jgi:hypothetical protein